MKEMQRQSGAFEGTDPDSLYAYKDALEQAAENIPRVVRYRPGLRTRGQQRSNARPRNHTARRQKRRKPHRFVQAWILTDSRSPATCSLAYAVAHPFLVGAPRSVANRIVVSSPPPFKTAPYKGIDFGIVFPTTRERATTSGHTIAQLDPVLMAFVDWNATRSRQARYRGHVHAG